MQNHLPGNRLIPCLTPWPWPWLSACLLVSGNALAVPLTVTVTDAAGLPQIDAVVSVEVRGVRQTAAPGTQADLGQRGRNFTPRVLAIQSGTAVNFPNFDTVRHHVYSFSQAKPFELKLYSGTPSAPVVFDKAGTAVLGCNIHDRMTAFVHVVNTPHFARTSGDGVATLDVPAGEHTLQVWHPMHGDTSLPQRQAIKVGGGASNAVIVKVSPSRGATAP